MIDLYTGLLIVGGLGFGIFILAVWLGFFKRMEIKESIFPGGTFVYVDWRGSLRNLKDPFHQVYETFLAYRRNNQDCPTDEQVPSMGIYYDDPGNLKNPDHFRCCAGFLILDTTPASSKRALLDYMVKKGYQVRDMPRTRSIHGSFPHKISMISYPLGASKFYPASLKFMG